MKILIVRMWPEELNIKNYNCQELGLAKAMVKKGNQCDIVLYTKDITKKEEYIKYENNKEIHIYYLKAKKILKNAFFDNELYKIAQNYDIVQTTEYDQIANMILYKKTNGKLVVYHGPYNSSFTTGYNIKCIFSDFLYMFNNKYKRVKCLAKSNLAKKLLNNKGFFNVETIGVGLDTSRLEIDNIKDNDFIEKLYKDKEQQKLKYLLYIGKIEKRRNILFLISLLSKNINDNIKLIIIGNGEEKYKKKCLKYAKKMGVFDKIIYKENIGQEEVKKIYKIADIFLLPTEYEIFGMVLLEAMYLGLPVITTLNGGSSTIIENNVDGIICNLDISKWNKAINKLLNDNKFYKNISENSSNKIKTKYTWDALSIKFIKNYEEVISNH